MIFILQTLTLWLAFNALYFGWMAFGRYVEWDHLASQIASAIIGHQK
jgi:hypothetical protein